MPTSRAVRPVLPSVVLGDVKGIRGDSDAPDPPGGAGGSQRRERTPRCSAPGGDAEPSRVSPGRSQPGSSLPSPESRGGGEGWYPNSRCCQSNRIPGLHGCGGDGSDISSLGVGSAGRRGSAVGWERGGGARGAEVSVRDTGREVMGAEPQGAADALWGSATSPRFRGKGSVGRR